MIGVVPAATLACYADESQTVDPLVYADIVRQTSRGLWYFERIDHGIAASVASDGAMRRFLRDWVEDGGKPDDVRVSRRTSGVFALAGDGGMVWSRNILSAPEGFPFPPTLALETESVVYWDTAGVWRLVKLPTGGGSLAVYGRDVEGRHGYELFMTAHSEMVECSRRMLPVLPRERDGSGQAVELGIVERRGSGSVDLAFPDARSDAVNWIVSVGRGDLGGASWEATFQREDDGMDVKAAGSIKLHRVGVDALPPDLARAYELGFDGWTVFAEAGIPAMRQDGPAGPLLGWNAVSASWEPMAVLPGVGASAWGTWRWVVPALLVVVAAGGAILVLRARSCAALRPSGHPSGRPGTLQRRVTRSREV